MLLASSQSFGEGVWAYRPGTSADGAGGLVPLVAAHDLKLVAGVDAALLHGSGRNRTAGFRRAISCHCASATCRYREGEAPLPGDSRPYVLVRGREHAGGI